MTPADFPNQYEHGPLPGIKGGSLLPSQSTGKTKLLLTVQEAADLLGVGRTLMYELISSGAVVSVQVGRLRRIRIADLEVYAAGLAPADTDHTLSRAA